MSDFNRIAASKRLSRYRLTINDGLMKANIIWCRTAYSSVEQTRIPNNKHSFYELHYLMSGGMKIGFDDLFAYDMKANDFIIVPPGTNHYINYTEPDTEKFVCGFTVESESDLITGATDELRRDRRVYTEEAVVRPLIDLMLVNANEQKAASSIVIANLLECVLIELFRQICPRLSEKNEDFRSFDSDVRVAEAKKYINSHIRFGVTVADVAKHLNISPRQLNRLINAHLGCTVNKLITDGKTELIRTLLNSSELSLNDIAEITGFCSEYSMNRFFKQNEGMTVGMYRRSIEK